MTDTPVMEACPNPWCGSTDAYAARMGHGYWRVCCDDQDECGVRGPRCDTEAEAIAAWNTRTGSGTPSTERIGLLVGKLQAALADEWDLSYFRRGSRGDYVNPDDEEPYLEVTETDIRTILAGLCVDRTGVGKGEEDGRLGCADRALSASPTAPVVAAPDGVTIADAACIPNAGRGDFDSAIAVRRDTPFGGHVHLGVGGLTVAGVQEAAVGIEIGHPDAEGGIVACFALRLPTFSVLLEAMMECFQIAQGIEAAEADETRSGSAVGESPVGSEADDAPNPSSPETQDKGAIPIPPLTQDQREYLEAEVTRTERSRNYDPDKIIGGTQDKGDAVKLAEELDEHLDAIHSVPGPLVDRAVDDLGTWAFNNSPAILNALRQSSPPVLDRDADGELTEEFLADLPVSLSAIPDLVFIRFSGDNKHIRKWSLEPFEFSVPYVVPSPDTGEGGGVL